MNSEKPFTHINGHPVEDPTARQSIEQLNQVTTQNIGLLNESINQIKEKVRESKYVFVGDSYLEGYTPEGSVSSWGPKVANILGLKETNYQIVAFGGSGFTRSDTKTFTQMVSELSIDEAVTDVIVCGGYNDQGTSKENLLSYMSTFKETCKTKFPNAKISVGHIGWAKNHENVYRLHVNISKYKRCASELGLTYLTNVEYALKDIFSDFSSDGFHPNEKGQISLASAIASAIVSGQANIQLKFKNIQMTPANEDWSITSMGNLACSVNNGITTIYSQDPIVIGLGQSTINIDANNSLIELGTITDGYVSGGVHSQLSLPVNCVIGYIGGYASMPGKLVITNSKLYLRLYNTNQYVGANAFGHLDAAYLLQIQIATTSIDSTLC